MNKVGKGRNKKMGPSYKWGEGAGSFVHLERNKQLIEQRKGDLIIFFE